MNTYKVTATRSDGTEISDAFTEPTEDAARKSFKECYRHDIYSVTGIELVRDNAPPTKDQERVALAKIRQIIKELGPNSYVGTAFEGCFEDAEENIENDFAGSMKQRIERAEYDLKEISGKFSDAEGRLKELGRLVDSLKEERNTLERKLAEQTLPAWLSDELRVFVSETVERARESMAYAAELMADMAESPQDIAFTGAVGSYRKAKERCERYELMLSGLNEIHPAE